jgi:hypothetical protein
MRPLCWRQNNIVFDGHDPAIHVATVAHTPPAARRPDIRVRSFPRDFARKRVAVRDFVAEDGRAHGRGLEEMLTQVVS